MPRYFFHITDGRSIIDEDGIELANRDEAWRSAVDLAGGVLRDKDRTMRPGEGMALTVTEDGKQVCWRIAVTTQSYVPEP